MYLKKLAQHLERQSQKNSCRAPTERSSFPKKPLFVEIRGTSEQIVLRLMRGGEELRACSRN